MQYRPSITASRWALLTEQCHEHFACMSTLSVDLNCSKCELLKLNANNSCVQWTLFILLRWRWLLAVYLRLPDPLLTRWILRFLFSLLHFRPAEDPVVLNCNSGTESVPLIPRCARRSTVSSRPVQCGVLLSFGSVLPFEGPFQLKIQLFSI